MKPKGNDGQPPPGLQGIDPGAPLGGVAPSTASPGREAERASRDSAAGASRRQRRAPTAGGSTDVNPMDFWRSGRPRSAKTAQVLPGGKKPSLMHSIRHMYFPPWVPVAVIIVTVFGILGLLFVTRSATGAPHIGQDHWHAQYTYYKCGNKMPNAPTWESGVHTHGDGIMHIHPFQSYEEGSGARMVKWFEYGGGELSDDTIRLPGESKDNTVHNGDTCPDGTPEAGETGVLQVFVNGAKLDSWTRYIPHDGDQIKIIFGKADSVVQLDDRQVISEAPTRHIDIDITGTATSGAFSPSAPTINAGETVQLDIHNKTPISHQFRVVGADGKPNTADDFVAVPVGSDPTTADKGIILQPNTDGFVVVRFDNAAPAGIAFEDSITDTGIANGNLIVQGVSSSATPTPGPQVNADVTANMVMGDSGYTPSPLTVAGAAGKTVGITLTNTGKFVHNLHIDGPDGQFGTDDDIISNDIPPLAAATPTPTPTVAPTGTETAAASATAAASGSPSATPSGVNQGSVSGKLNAGTYHYRDDFHPEITGTIVIQ
ncbi:MAG: hypothetical protein ABI559_05765 [Chloroflexota bacterium]